MNMLHSRPMPVADHFMASRPSRPSRDDVGGQTSTAELGEVCETCHAYCAAGKAELWRHARDEHGAHPDLSCHMPGCGRRFFAAAMSADHRAHHSDAADRRPADQGGQPPLTCELCGRLYVSPSTYDKHVNAAHPYARAATCGVCHSYKGDVRSLVDHVRRRHASEIATTAAAGSATRRYDPKRDGRRSIRCTVCGKRYGNNRNMRAHRLVHGLVDDFVPAQPPLRAVTSGAPAAARAVHHFGRSIRRSPPHAVTSGAPAAARAVHHFGRSIRRSPPHPVTPGAPAAARAVHHFGRSIRHSPPHPETPGAPAVHHFGRSIRRSSPYAVTPGAPAAARAVHHFGRSIRHSPPHPETPGAPAAARAVHHFGRSIRRSPPQKVHCPVDA